MFNDIQILNERLSKIADVQKISRIHGSKSDAIQIATRIKGYSNYIVGEIEDDTIVDSGTLAKVEDFVGAGTQDERKAGRFYICC